MFNVLTEPTATIVATTAFTGILEFEKETCAAATQVFGCGGCVGPVRRQGSRSGEVVPHQVTTDAADGVGGRSAPNIGVVYTIN